MTLLAVLALAACLDLGEVDETSAPGGTGATGSDAGGVNGDEWAASGGSAGDQDASVDGGTKCGLSTCSGAELCCGGVFCYDAACVNCCPAPGGGGAGGNSGSGGASGGTGGAAGPGVLCGGPTCKTGDYCCVLGTTSECLGLGDQCGDGGQGTPVYCDGPEDCPGMVCCGKLGVGKYLSLGCVSAGGCAAQDERVVCGSSPGICPTSAPCKPSVYLPQYNMCAKQ